MTVARPIHGHPLIRGIGAGRAVLGGVVIARPETAARWVGGSRRPHIPPVLARALGARLVVQALAELARPTRRVSRVSAAVDGTHAVSMLGVLGLDRRYRRAAAINAVASTASALLLALDAGPTEPGR